MAAFTDADVQHAKKFYDPDLIDALLTQADEIDLSEAYNVALSILVNRLPYSSPFDRLALQRRTYEAALLNEEVAMFQELGKLLASIAARYDAVTGSRPSIPLEGGAA